MLTRLRLALLLKRIWTLVAWKIWTVWPVLSGERLKGKLGTFYDSIFGLSQLRRLAEYVFRVFKILQPESLELYLFHLCR